MAAEFEKVVEKRFKKLDYAVEKLPIDEANGPLAMRLQRVCHDTLSWLISFSLDDIDMRRAFRY